MLRLYFYIFRVVKIHQCSNNQLGCYFWREKSTGDCPHENGRLMGLVLGYMMLLYSVIAQGTWQQKAHESNRLAGALRSVGTEADAFNLLAR